ncbi:MAG: EamA family transporter [Clostridia bacterium]|nr:EamA family transporter [Clostridia bacterium]
MTERKSKGTMFLAMAIFSSVGLFVRNIALPSAVIAVMRGLVGAALLLPLMRREAATTGAKGRGETPALLLSGVLMGVNWILLFEAYRFTTVASATLVYYLEPTLLILFAVPVLGQRPGKAGWICCALALIGMVPLSGVLGGNGAVGFRGVLLAFGAAVLYTAVVLFNMRLKGMPPIRRTVLQLFIAGAVLVPYVLLQGGFQALFTADAKSLALLAVVCAVHTGLAYALWFTAVPHVAPQDAAILSYTDPVLAVVWSAVLLGESFGWAEALGAVLILGSALFYELWGRRKNKG